MRRVLVLGALLLASVYPATPAGGQAATSATADPGEAAPGEELNVSGSGWTPNARVHASICGNLALRGSSDCDLPGSRTMVTNADGDFMVRLGVAVPPAPCPCVLYVTGEGTETTVRFPVKIIGAPGAAPTQALPVQSTPGFEVSARIAGSPAWPAWFGGSAERDLVLEVRNTTEVARTPNLSVTWGTNDTPTHVVDVPTVEPIDPGAVREIRIPVEVDALTIGRVHVGGSVSGAGPGAEFSTSVSSYPWGLIALAAVAVQLLLLAVRNRVRDRIHRVDIDSIDVEEVDEDDLYRVLELQPGPTFDEEAPEVIDLRDEPLPEPIAVGPVTAPPPSPAPARNGATTSVEIERPIDHEIAEICRVAEIQAERLMARGQALHDRNQAILAEARSAVEEVFDIALRRTEEITQLLEAVDHDTAVEGERLRMELHRIRADAERSIAELRALAVDEPVVLDLTQFEHPDTPSLDAAIARAVQRSLR